MPNPEATATAQLAIPIQRHIIGTYVYGPPVRCRHYANCQVGAGRGG